MIWDPKDIYHGIWDKSRRDDEEMHEDIFPIEHEIRDPLVAPVAPEKKKQSKDHKPC